MVRDITKITKGIIMHQVNCQNVMGAGVAKTLYTKYPTIKTSFHRLATEEDYDTPEKRFGKLQVVPVTDQLIVLNSFSQLYYGRQRGVVYTDEDALLTNLLTLDRYAKSLNLPAYVPARIGCGLAGGNWSRVKAYIDTYTDIIIVYP